MTSLLTPSKVRSVNYFDLRMLKDYFFNKFNILNIIQIKNIHGNWNFFSYNYLNKRKLLSQSEFKSE